MYEIQFLRALGLTIGIETLALFLAAHNPWKTLIPPIPAAAILLCGVVSSGLTLPYVWFVWPAFVKNFVLYAVLAETFAIVAEAGILTTILRIPLKTAVGLSALCNICSAGIGRILTLL